MNVSMGNIFNLSAQLFLSVFSSTINKQLIKLSAELAMVHTEIGLSNLSLLLPNGRLML